MTDRKALAARVEELEAERDEAIRRRDKWRKKAEGYDEVRNALREKVGAPWPPNLSRALWAGIAADEKKRADDAEAERDRLREALQYVVGASINDLVASPQPEEWGESSGIAVGLRALGCNSLTLDEDVIAALKGEGE